MTYKEALEYIHSIEWRGSRPGLSRIRELCAAIGNPQKNLCFVHVAGTNGKGSFCAMLESVLRASGHKTGLFTSPYVKTFRERMRVGGENITEEELTSIIEFIKPFADSMADLPTEFELITAAAFEYFRRSRCDIVVLEVGMGGRLDSTNIIDPPELAAIGEISLDHTSFLGSTINAIAGEKAGIIKDDSPVLFYGTDKEAYSVIESAAKNHGCEFRTPDYDALFVKKSTPHGSIFDYKEMRDVKIPLAGLYQPKNATAVIEAAQMLAAKGWNITEETIKAGLLSVSWPARFELLRENPIIIFDGGHNPQGVRACADSVAAYFSTGRCVTVLTGIMKDKDTDVAASVISEMAASVYTVTPANARALSAAEYAVKFREHSVPATPCETVGDGVRAAVADAVANNRPLIINGSLYLYEEALRELDIVCPKS